MNWLAIRKGLWSALPLSGLGLCLFGDCTPLKNTYVLALALAEIAAVLSDPGSQWMVFVCAGVYFLAFVAFRRRLVGAGRMGTRRNASLPGELWLLGLLALAALAYAFDYARAVGPTQALTLLGAAMLGQGAGLWESRKRKAESRNGAGTESPKSPGRMLVGVLVPLLTVAAVWQTETGHFFQYRGQARWSGPWDSPNTFGILMAVGVVLAVGRLVQSRVNAECGVRSAELPNAQGSTQNAECAGEHPTSNIQHRTSNKGLWVRRVLLLAATGVMGVGLVKSYSRGAWVGAAVALTYLLLKAESRKQKAETGEPKAGIGGARHWVALAVICGSVAVLGFWTFGHTEGAVARRAYSVANAHDFSWRNRLAAWEGALQMMAEKPWFGFGWNQPERIYSAFYCPAKVDEGMAFQLNDYFMLGATLGVPALLCFAVYIVLALSGRQKTGLPAPPTLDFRLWTLDSSAVCRAGAVVLLVGFWFDGGLFKLATGATFWILLELGRAGDHEMHEAHENG